MHGVTRGGSPRCRGKCYLSQFTRRSERRAIQFFFHSSFPIGPSDFPRDESNASLCFTTLGTYGTLFYSEAKAPIVSREYWSLRRIYLTPSICVLSKLEIGVAWWCLKGFEHDTRRLMHEYLAGLFTPEIQLSAYYVHAKNQCRVVTFKTNKRRKLQCRAWCKQFLENNEAAYRFISVLCEHIFLSLSAFCDTLKFRQGNSIIDGKRM